MKTLFIALALLGFTLTGFGQGTILFSNREIADGIDAPIYNFDGKPLSGADWYAQLYYAPVNSTTFTPAGDPLIFRTGNRAGYFDNTVDQNRILPGIVPGANVQIQIRVWESVSGNNFEHALQVGKIAMVFGNLAGFGYLIVGTGGAGSPPSLPWPLFGLSPMHLQQIPEPSTIALGLVGAGVLFLRRRR